jgi:hypothetical protein
MPWRNGNATSFLSTEIQGYERFELSQYSASVLQGLPPFLGATQGLFVGEVGGVHVHGFKEGLPDASVSVRPDASGARRLGLAARSSWGYRLHSRLDYTDVLGMRSVSPSLTWIHDVSGNAPITLGTLLEGNKSVIVGIDVGIANSLDARVSYRSFVNKGTTPIASAIATSSRSRLPAGSSGSPSAGRPLSVQQMHFPCSSGAKPVGRRPWHARQILHRINGLSRRQGCGTGRAMGLPRT